MVPGNHLAANRSSCLCALHVKDCCTMSVACMSILTISLDLKMHVRSVHVYVLPFLIRTCVCVCIMRISRLLFCHCSSTISMESVAAAPSPFCCCCTISILLLLSNHQRREAALKWDCCLAPCPVQLMALPFGWFIKPTIWQTVALQLNGHHSSCCFSFAIVLHCQLVLAA